MKKNPVIILHGWNLSGDRFQPLVEIFKTGKYICIAPDLPGFGNNKDLSRAYVLDDYLAFLENFLKRKKFNKIILIGHSFGGRIAIKYAAVHRQKIKLLVLTGVPGFLPVKKIKVLFFLLISKIGKYIFGALRLSSIADFFRKLLYKAAKSTDYYKADGLLRDTFISIIRENLEIPMRKIKVPTILIWGAEDRTVPLSVAYKMEKTINNSVLEVIRGTNHRVPYAAPKVFFKIISKYLNQ
jgi:pimeloyl-ACP methyl ester carboxylesterase